MAPDAIERAAVDAVNAGRAGELATLFETAAHLEKLDNSAMLRIFRAMAAHPSPATEALCLRVAKSEAFLRRPLRMNYLLEALAAVRPMKPDSAALFRETSASDYYAVNAPLLAANGSKAALAVLEEMLLDSRVPMENRVAAMRRAIPPVRTNAGMLSMADSMLRKAMPDLLSALGDVMFDYRVNEWYGVARNPPVAADWNKAPAANKATALRIAKSFAANAAVSAGVRARAAEFARTGS